MTKREWALFAVLQGLGVFCAATGNMHDYQYRILFGVMLLAPGSFVAAILLNFHIYSAIAHSSVMIGTNAIFWSLVVKQIRRGSKVRQVESGQVAKSGVSTR